MASVGALLGPRKTIEETLESAESETHRLRKDLCGGPKVTVAHVTSRDQHPRSGSLTTGGQDRGGRFRQGTGAIGIACSEMVSRGLESSGRGTAAETDGQFDQFGGGDRITLDVDRRGGDVQRDQRVGVGARYGKRHVSGPLLRRRLEIC